MRLALVEVPEELVKSHWVGHAVLATESESPFAEQTRLVTRGLQHAGDRDVRKFQGMPVTCVGVVSDPRMAGVEALQAAAKAGTDFSLAAVCPDAMRVFKLARLDIVFSIHPDLETALAAKG